jgi:hypothetical protein
MVFERPVCLIVGGIGHLFIFFGAIAVHEDDPIQNRTTVNEFKLLRAASQPQNLSAHFGLLVVRGSWLTSQNCSYPCRPGPGAKKNAGPRLAMIPQCPGLPQQPVGRPCIHCDRP